MSKSWAALRRGEPMYGAFLSTGSTVSAEVVGSAGFDFVVIDLEHGMGSEAALLPQLQAIEHTPALACVRVESHERQRAHRVLDLGARGVMFPRVDTAGQARACLAAMRYPPAGVRGVAMLVRASDFGRRFLDYRDSAEESLLAILQIETAEAVANAGEIAAVDGAGVLFIGPMDLSTSLGVFRDYQHPRFLEALDKVTSAAARHSRALGILAGSPEEAVRYRAMGFTFLMCGTDVSFLRNAAQQTSEAMRR